MLEHNLITNKKQNDEVINDELVNDELVNDELVNKLKLLSLQEYTLILFFGKHILLHKHTFNISLLFSMYYSTTENEWLETNNIDIDTHKTNNTFTSGKYIPLYYLPLILIHQEDNFKIKCFNILLQFYYKNTDKNQIHNLANIQYIHTYYADLYNKFIKEITPVFNFFEKNSTIEPMEIE